MYVKQETEGATCSKPPGNHGISSAILGTERAMDAATADDVSSANFEPPNDYLVLT
jgi:Flp pilus assembly protein CpaB